MYRQWTEAMREREGDRHIYREKEEGERRDRPDVKTREKNTCTAGCRPESNKTSRTMIESFSLAAIMRC